MNISAVTKELFSVGHYTPTCLSSEESIKAHLCNSNGDNPIYNFIIILLLYDLRYL